MIIQTHVTAGVVLVVEHAREKYSECSLVCSTQRSRFTEADSGGSSFFRAERGYVHLFV